MNEITSVNVLVLDAWMDARDIVSLCSERANDLPECSFLEDLHHPAQLCLNKKLQCSECSASNDTDASFCKKCGKAIAVSAADFKVKLTNFWWYGEGSGWSHDFLLADVAPLVHGEVDVIFCWEGGGHSGLAIKDGKVARCTVKHVLVKPQGW